MNRLCKCGCGERVLSDKARFLHGHIFRKLSKAARKRRSKTFWKNMSEETRARRTVKVKRGLRRYWTPERRAKQSEFNKQIWSSVSPVDRKARGTKIAKRSHAKKSTAEYKRRASNIMKEVWQRPEYIHKQILSHRDEVVKTKRSESVHASWALLTAQERKERVLAVNLGVKVKPTKPESDLNKILQSNFPKEFRLNVFGDFVIDGKVPDFVNVNGKKVLIELFGDYWHGTKFTGQSCKEHESRRKKAFKKFGFDTIVVWETELKDEQRLVNKLRRFLQ